MFGKRSDETRTSDDRARAAAERAARRAGKPLPPEAFQDTVPPPDAAEFKRPEPQHTVEYAPFETPEAEPTVRRIPREDTEEHEVDPSSPIAVSDPPPPPPPAPRKRPPTPPGSPQRGRAGYWGPASSA